MKVAVVGCAHGSLDSLYSQLSKFQLIHSITIDLLLICGDFQAVRDKSDLQSMSVPPKYRHLGDFHGYYRGVKKAPLPTIFIGGNHESSAYLKELYYGGWVSENIYYLGASGVVRFGPLRIAGVSGIYNPFDYYKCYSEKFPLNDRDLRSIYHIRHYEVCKLLQISRNLDIFLSHDWPTNIAYYGNYSKLLKIKPFFQTDIQTGKLGNPMGLELLKKLKPDFWFSAHLHVKFSALVDHSHPDHMIDELTLNENDKLWNNDIAMPEPTLNMTRFLALDKILPKRQWFQVIDIIPMHTDEKDWKFDFYYDEEWLAILKAFNSLYPLSMTRAPGSTDDHVDGNTGQNEALHFNVTEEQFQGSLEWVKNKFKNESERLLIPKNFKSLFSDGKSPQSSPQKICNNSQTISFCELLEMQNQVFTN